MHRLIPDFILEQYDGGQHKGQFEAVCLFVDISGFTPLTNTLMVHGTEGIEIIADVLGEVFLPLVQLVYERGGFIATFAGDAFKAIFPLDKSAHDRTVAAAWQIRETMRQRPSFDTPFGTFHFAVKVTVADGLVEWGIWQGRMETAAQNALYYFEGEALANCLLADLLAKADEVLLSQHVYEQLSPEMVTACPLDTYQRLVAVRDSLLLAYPSQSMPGALKEMKRAQSFYPIDLLRLPTRGEFRRVVTVFINLKSLPDNEAFQRLLFRLLHTYGGYLCRLGRIGAKDKGATLLLFWGAPYSHENDVMRALSFVLDLQTAAATSLKAGITDNLAYAGFIGSPLREEYTCHGSSVNLAARQMAMAAWGEIWLDEATAAKVQNEFMLTQKGDYRFKGFDTPHSIFQLHSQRLSSQRLYTTHLIGRNNEMTQLEAAVRPLSNGHFAGLILVMGEAGLGKTRLVHEFMAALPLASFSLFLCQTDEILRQSLNPFRYWLRHYFKQTADETLNKETFRRILDELIQATADADLKNELWRTHSFLAALLNLYWPDSLYSQLEPKLRFANILTALKTLIKAESLRRPVILLVEDMHWLDADSWHLLQDLLIEAEQFPLAVLATTRPQIVPGADLPKAAIISLSPLDTTALSELATANLKDEVSSRLVNLLSERAGGNPFFAEQLLLYLQEHGLLRYDKVWDVVATETILLPLDVRSLLVARLDRLSPMVKQVVQTAAILGHEFSIPLLVQMIGEVEEALQAASKAAVWVPLNETVCMFRHALLRDAAYEMLLHAQRRRLHQLAAEGLEKLYGADLTHYYSQLAYHAEKADLMDKARFYWQKAGDVATVAYQIGAAETYYSRALALTPSSEMETQCALLLARERVYMTLGYQDLRGQDLDALEHLLAGVKESDMIPQRAQVTADRSHHALTIGNYKRGRVKAQQAVQLASIAEDVSLIADSLLRLGQGMWYLGEYKAAKQELNRALSLAETADLPHTQTNSLRLLGVVAAVQGHYEEASDYFKRSLTLSREIGDRQNIGGCLNNLGALALYRGNYAACRTYHEEALVVRREIGDRYGEGIALGNLGDVHFQQGHIAEAKTYYARSLQLRQVVNDRPGQAWVLHKLGEFFQTQEDLLAAKQYYEESLQIRQEMGNRREEAESLNSLGIVARLQGQFGIARSYHEKAIEISRELGDRPGEMIILRDFGRLYCRLGQWQRAKIAWEQALPISRDMGNCLVEGQLLGGLGMVACYFGDNNTARNQGHSVLVLAQAMGQRHLEADGWELLAMALSGLSCWQEARKAFTEALHIRQELAQVGLTAVAHAGLARISLAQGDRPSARLHITPVLDYLAAGGCLDMVEVPGWVYLTCWQVLQADDLERAEVMLVTAMTHLQRQANDLPDLMSRQSFWDNITWHKQICSLFKIFKAAGSPLGNAIISDLNYGCES